MKALADAIPTDVCYSCTVLIGSYAKRADREPNIVKAIENKLVAQLETHDGAVSLDLED